MFARSITLEDGSPFSHDWELLTREVVEQCGDILTDARVLDAVRVTSWWIPTRAKEACRSFTV